MTLIDRLSKLDGPDRGLDAEICILLQYGGENSEGAVNVRTDPEWDDNDLLFEINEEGCCNPIPELTDSVDAAIALSESVLPGYRWSAGFSRHVPHNAQIWVASGSGYYEGESDANRAIAICIAILRAKGASHDAR